jgi:hypothetical protein
LPSAHSLCNRNNAGQPGALLFPQAVESDPSACGAAKRRYVPNCDIVKLFDHFIGRRLNGQGHDQAERLRGLEVDDEFVRCACIIICGDGLGSAYLLLTELRQSAQTMTDSNHSAH